MSVSFYADRLADWPLAGRIGARIGGHGPEVSGVERAGLREDFGELLPEAERLVAAFTGLRPAGYASRPWVMSRAEWVTANLRGFQVVMEPVAKTIEERSVSVGPVGTLRRAFLGAEIGALLGYMSRRVLGQYDLFLPPDDEGLIYFVGPNVIGLERRHGFRSRDFRLWLSLHEVAHRLQFGGVPWLRGHVSQMVDSYLGTLDLDVKKLVELARGAAEEVMAGRVERGGLGWVTLFMTPEQREMFRHMQAMMALLEGHSSYVMNQVGRGRVRSLETFNRRLRERRRATGPEGVFQRAIGFEIKARQYDMGERFVAGVVERAGMEGFNRVWERPASLPTLEEVSSPDEWVARVGAA